jgi:hypothetical protein
MIAQTVAEHLHPENIFWLSINQHVVLLGGPINQGGATL